MTIGSTLNPPPGPARHRCKTGQDSCRRPASLIVANHAPDAKSRERLQWDVRRGMSTILNHPWIPTDGADAMTVRGFIYDVDTGKLDEVSYPGSMGSIA